MPGKYPIYSSCCARGIPAPASRTPSPDAGGGIGLAIVAGIVAAHHGTVDVENHGPGCRFEIRLPISAAG